MRLLDLDAWEAYSTVRFLGVLSPKNIGRWLFWNKTTDSSSIMYESLPVTIQKADEDITMPNTTREHIGSLH